MNQSPTNTAGLTPMAKAMACAHDAACTRLHAGASALNKAIPAHGVVFDRKLTRPGRAPVRVLLRWPGVLLVLCADSGETVRECYVRDMHAQAPAEAAFVADAMKGKPLAHCDFQRPQGARLRATFGADGVVRVHAARGSAELLAESEPGQPTVLRAGFTTLTPQDLAPRLS